ncbi:hypothetical protein TNCT_97431 [Trichonephila clavata]|uniref:Uncharacterized protein n=1 Tax=Trichonephila clavata TaxID=2740835 RepID=A0A8X6FUD8_TRICU|nr:hypothetical protein TNCT_97431 [Trichonephila clavata]
MYVSKCYSESGSDLCNERYQNFETNNAIEAVCVIGPIARLFKLDLSRFLECENVTIEMQVLLSYNSPEGDLKSDIVNRLLCCSSAGPELEILDMIHANYSVVPEFELEKN